MLKESVKDCSGIFYFPPRFIYHSKVEKHNTIKRTLLPEIEKHLEENADKIVNRWVSSNVISSYHFDETNGEMLFNNEELLNAIWDAFNECVFFLDDDAWANLTEVSKTAVISSMWYNKYKPGGNQEIHNHLPHHFSGVYYLENTGIVNTTWYNPDNYFPGGDFDHVNCDPNLIGPDTSMSKVSEGYIVMFPGPLPHYVPEVKHDKITISFNIDISGFSGYQ